MSNLPQIGYSQNSSIHEAHPRSPNPSDVCKQRLDGCGDEGIGPFCWFAGPMSRAQSREEVYTTGCIEASIYFQDDEVG